MFKKLRYWLYRLHFNHPELFNHKPIHLDLEISRACNLKCLFCYRQEKNFIEKFPNDLMTTLEAQKKLAEYCKRGLYSVKLNWRGEPLLHDGIGYLAKYAEQLGYLDRMINTNLALPRIPLTFLHYLDSFTEIRVSLDTVEKSYYEKMRPPAKLEKVIDNLHALIERFNPKKTRVIIQRRTNTVTESNSEFFMHLWFLLSRKKWTVADKFEKNVKIDSKPIQPRTTSAWRGCNSYFVRWQRGELERQYCKQPSQRIVVGVDGKEWSCCLAYKEPGELEFNKHKEIIKLLNSNMLPPVCFECSSFTAYKEKEKHA